MPLHHANLFSSLPSFNLNGNNNLVQKMRILLLFSAIFLLKVISCCEYRVFSSSLSATTASATKVSVSLDYQYKNGLTINVMRDGKVLQQIITSDDLGSSVDPVVVGDTVQFSGQNKAVTISKVRDDTTYTEFKVTRELQRGELARDCLSFDAGVHWYGGPQMKTTQYWPIERQNFTNEAYVTKEKESMAVTERYWLNSRGVFVYVMPKAPLFITQRPYEVLCLMAKKEAPYNTDSRFFTFEYVIGVAKDPKEAHLKAVEHHLLKPSGLPDETMVKFPIWSTWAKYLANIDTDIVTAYATEIKTKEFKNSQLEIDDLWEVCYGSLRIDKNKFGDMLGLTTALTGLGYRTTLWIHPFINVGCEPEYTFAKTAGYFVKNSTGGVLTKWWNTPREDQWASYIDFTNPDAVAWYKGRLDALKTAGGFHSYKFDAGETSWAPTNPVLKDTANKELHPGLLTTAYIDAVKTYGTTVEVRSVQGNQNMDIFVRMIDKDSFWDYRNGLPTLVTTLLQMNMNGYPFVLPDMIGGNNYPGSKVEKELFIRWMQANVFMPSMQYSIPPWDFDVDGASPSTEALAKTFNTLHETHAPAIMTAMQKAIDDGTPVNPPIWWIAPTDPVALSIGDQFLLGEKILVAPVLVQGATTRSLYLPAGTWTDGNNPNGQPHVGPKNLTVDASLSILPHFFLQ